MGTYVKSSKETHLAVGDKNNDSTRVNANELQCKVIGEGGNLGFTQLARVEYYFGGGLIYTDFIDNSAGVDCSDHEVNIKILLNEIVTRGDMTIKQRNSLLKAMTEEVSSLVLQHNYKQTAAISLIGQHAYINLDLHIKYINYLEKENKIDRKVEYLPSTEELKDRKKDGKGLTMPGISVVFSYTKNLLREEILNSDVPDDQYCRRILLNFFPKDIREKYQEYIFRHRLKREIISTILSNDIVNEVGFTFVHRLKNETGDNASKIVKAYLVAKKIFRYDELREEILKLDNIITTKVQNDILMQLSRLMRRATRWILRGHREDFTIDFLIKNYQDKAQKTIGLLKGALKGYDLSQYEKKLEDYRKLNVPENIASYCSMSRALHAVLDCVDASIKFNLPISKVINVYFELGNDIGLSWIRSKIISANVSNSWDALSREALRDDLDWQQKRLVVAILYSNNDPKTDIDISGWKKQHLALIDRWEEVLHDIKEQSTTSFTVFFVAIRELLDLTQASSKSLSELSTIK
ncbi:MAG: NAD-glutamate dehydrogenase [Legionellales bacterium]|nr:NAD-glutamate dehydrogenase [Legionellales bacterium]